MKQEEAKCSLEDAYYEICIIFEKLCPRLVPRSLWGASLAHLARADSEVICGLFCEEVNNNSCIDNLNLLHEWWFSLPRDHCVVCGSPANEIDEDWRYYVKNSIGLAILERLIPLCAKCHLAKHLGYARVHGRYREALEHLAQINNVNIEVAESVAKKAFRVWGALSRIGKWKIVIKTASGVPEHVKETAENILNFMVSSGYGFDKHWLYYCASIEQCERLEEIALEESIELLKEVFSNHQMQIKKIMDSIKSDAQARSAIVRKLEEKLKRYGIKVVYNNVELALKKIRIKEGLLTKIPIENIKPEYIFDVSTLNGKWIVFVPRRLCGIIFRKIIERLREEGLDYFAKTVGVRENKDERPVIVYVPSFLAVSVVRRVAEIIVEILRDFKVDKLVMFKPDTFTLENIYGRRSYVYATSLHSLHQS